MKQEVGRSPPLRSGSRHSGSAPDPVPGSGLSASTANAGDFGLLRALVEDDIARNGTMSSFMVRAGLLRDILDLIHSPWQPIETAPTTPVWIGRPYTGHGTGEMEPATINRPSGLWCNIYTGLAIAWRPTHWMPLPAPPAQGIDARQRRDPEEGRDPKDESPVGSSEPMRPDDTATQVQPS